MGNGELALKSPSINGNSDIGIGDLALESSAEKSKKKRNKKKRSVPESNSNKTDNDDRAGAVATKIDDNEPTVVEKPANVDLVENYGNCDTGNDDSALETTVEKSKKKKKKNKKMALGSYSNKLDDDDRADAVATQIDDNEPTMSENPADVDLIENDALEASVEKSKKKKKNKSKKMTPELNFNKIDDDGRAGAVATWIDDNEPTMAEKPVNVDLMENDVAGNVDTVNEGSTLEATVEKSKKKKKQNKKKKTAPGSDFNKIDDDDGIGEVGNQNDDSEPTMGEKLANLDLTKNDGDCKMIDDYIPLEASDGKSKKKKNRKKRKACESTSDKIDTGEVGANETQVDDNEPTIADKLANLDLQKNDGEWIQNNQDSSEKQLPSADSILVLLKQALHADDRALLLDCLYNRDDKVISKSVAQLNPADIFKLLNSLLFIIQSRGAILVCVLPWLRSLLLQHSSRIVSQESSLSVLNSIYQLIESRVSTFKPAIQLASSLDLLFAGIDEVEDDGFESAPPVIYEDDDESEEEESEEDRVETDEEERNEPEEFSGISDVDASDDDLMQF